MMRKLSTQTRRRLTALALLAPVAAFAQDPPPIDSVDVDKGPLAHSNQDDCGDPLGGARMVYVDQSADGAETGLCWRDAYVRLEDAIAHALANTSVTQIWVAQGVYVPSLDADTRHATFALPPRVTILGGFAGVEKRASDRNPDPATNGTVLSGDISGDDISGGNARKNNVYHVVTAAQRSAIDGFTIRAGYADESVGWRHIGAGLLHVGGTLRVENCNFVGSYAQSAGGGFASLAGNALLLSCTFEQNSAGKGGAAALLGSASTRVHFCDFLQNSADSSGGALFCTDSATPEIAGARFIGNQGGGDGGALTVAGGSSTLLISCLFNGNQAFMGGAISMVESATGNFFNLTGTHNAAMAEGAAFYHASASDAQLTNSIFWLNQAAGPDGQDDVYALDSWKLKVNYVCIEGYQGEFSGDRNTGADPMLVDAAGPDGAPGNLDDDVRLSASSPLIDAGNNVPLLEMFDPRSGSIGRAEYDLDGGLRLVDDPFTPDTGAGSPPMVDLGAFEFDRWVTPDG